MQPKLDGLSLLSVEAGLGLSLGNPAGVPLAAAMVNKATLERGAAPANAYRCWTFQGCLEA